MTAVVKFPDCTAAYSCVDKVVYKAVTLSPKLGKSIRLISYSSVYREGKSVYSVYSVYRGGDGV